MKPTKIIVLIFFLLSGLSYACDTCQLRQPKITQGITHGVGPESNWDWFIVGFIVIITLITLFYSVKFLVFPGEKNKKHIKNTVLRF